LRVFSYCGSRLTSLGEFSAESFLPLPYFCHPAQRVVLFEPFEIARGGALTAACLLNPLGLNWAPSRLPLLPFTPQFFVTARAVAQKHPSKFGSSADLVLPLICFVLTKPSAPPLAGRSLSSLLGQMTTSWSAKPFRRRSRLFCGSNSIYSARSFFFSPPLLCGRFFQRIGAGDLTCESMMVLSPLPLWNLFCVFA